MKKLLVVLCALAFAAPVSAAEKTQYLSDKIKPTAFFLELLGRGGAYSANIDHLISDNLALGIGFSMLSATSGTTSASIMILPVYANFYFASEHHRPFMTGGVDIVTGTVSSSGYSAFGSSGTVIVLGGGYEFRGESGFLFRAAPYYMMGSGGSMVTFGIGVGYAF